MAWQIRKLEKNNVTQGPLSKTERGFASIIITTVLIAIIGLIIVGFSLVVRRNQQETLDRQLSTQAYYAAETAVNEVRANAEAEFASTTKVTPQTDCTGSYTTPSFDTDGVEVTCINVNGSLDSLVYSSVSEGKDTFVPVIPTDPTDKIDEIIITWRTADANATTPEVGCDGSSLKLPPRTNWGTCGYGVIRTDIVDSLVSGGFATTALILPSATGVGAGSGATQFNPNGAWNVAWRKCNSTQCQASIDIPPAFQAAGKSFYMRLRSIYKDASVSVGARDSGGTVIKTSGQILIDATGKSQDVLRRIQVRVPVMNSNANIPMGAIEATGSICKRFVSAPGYIDGGLPGDLCKP